MLLLPSPPARRRVSTIFQMDAVSLLESRSLMTVSSLIHLPEVIIPPVEVASPSVATPRNLQNSDLINPTGQAGVAVPFGPMTPIGSAATSDPNSTVSINAFANAAAPRQSPAKLIEQAVEAALAGYKGDGPYDPSAYADDPNIDALDKNFATIDDPTAVTAGWKVVPSSHADVAKESPPITDSLGNSYVLKYYYEDGQHKITITYPTASVEHYFYAIYWTVGFADNAGLANEFLYDEYWYHPL